MNKINKAGIILICMLFMFDFLMIMFGIKNGKEGSVALFNLFMFFFGSLMFGYEE